MFHCVPCADVWNSYISHWYPLVRFDSVRLFSAGYGLNSVFFGRSQTWHRSRCLVDFPCPLSAHLGASTSFIKSFIGCALLVAHSPPFFVPHKMNRSSTKHIKITSLLWGVLHVRALMRPGVVFFTETAGKNWSVIGRRKAGGVAGYHDDLIVTGKPP